MTIAPGTVRAEEELTSALATVQASIPGEGNVGTRSYLDGMAATLEWLLGRSNSSPVRNAPGTPAEREVVFEASAAVLDAGSPRSRGAARVLQWSRGLRDDPVVTWIPR